MKENSRINNIKIQKKKLSIFKKKFKKKRQI